ncbi:MAG: hypothetical protein AAB355_02465 [Patescibacteria group bacterium]
MCKVPIVFLDETGHETRRGEIEVCEFAEKEHRLIGKEASVIVQRSTFMKDASDCIKNLIGGAMDRFFGFRVRAIDPGPEYPVVRINPSGDLWYWLPKGLCQQLTQALPAAV